MGHDSNIINYARDHGMVIVTSDGEMGRTCEANGFPCVLITLEKMLEKIITPELNRLKDE